MNASSKPTKQLKLKPGTEFIEIDDERLLVRGYSNSVVLSGSIIRAISPILSRENKFGKSFEVSEPEQESHESSQLREFFEVLADRGFAEAAETDTTLANSIVECRDSAYWSHNSHDPFPIKDKLKSTSIAVIGAGSIAATVKSCLIAGGVANVVAISPDSLLALFNDQQSNEQRSDTSASEAFGSIDFIVFASDGMEIAGIDTVNEFTQMSGIGWTLVRMDRHRAILGPNVIPGQTACFTCYELRSRANAEFPSEHAALYNHWKRVTKRPPDWPLASATAASVGNWVALDTLRLASGSHLSAVVGRIISLDMHSLQSNAQEILKLPRCPVCSSAAKRPQTRIWDLTKKKTNEKAKESEEKII
jgi:bacteriocin biosynthesis cyclodehydratase domain-containing protein